MTRSLSSLPQTSRRLRLFAAMLTLSALGAIAAGVAILEDPKPMPASPTPAPAKPASDPAYVLDVKAKRIDGTEEDLSIYRGKVVLIVNVASKCGYTPQYAGLEALYQAKKDAGLVILGFPSNDFGQQEPGTSEEIKAFCDTRYKITFPLFEKVGVKGDAAHPLFKKLAAQPAPIGGDAGGPKWNFTKYLVDRSGKVVARYESRVKPDDKELAKRIDELLGAKPE